MNVMVLRVDAVFMKAGSYVISPKSSGPVRTWRRSVARTAPSVIGISYDLPVRLSSTVSVSFPIVGSSLDAVRARTGPARYRPRPLGTAHLRHDGLPSRCCRWGDAGPCGALLPRSLRATPRSIADCGGL